MSPEILLTSSPNGLITAYSTISGTILARFSGSRSPPHGLTLVGKTCIAASHISLATASGSIHLYNWWSSSALHHLPLPEPVAPLVATPDGSFLFAGGLSGHLYALSIPSGNIVRSFHAHNKPLSCLLISPDSSLLISGGDDGFIVTMPIYPLVSDSASECLVLHRFVAHKGPVTAISAYMGLCFPIIASCSTDCTCKLWSVLDGTNLNTVAFPCPISGIVFGETGETFYGAGSDGVIYKGCFQVGSKRRFEVWSEKHGEPVVSVAMVNGGKNLVSAAEDGSVFVWEIERGRVIMVLGDNMEGISDVAVAKGIDNGKLGNGAEMNDAFCSGNEGLSGKQLRSRPIKDALDIEDVWGVAANDRRKAIDMLESAIGVYEKLLKLILKEAKGGTNKNNELEQSKM
ncbi:hypothetical protein M5689_013758 [Euphorbia peplus]|nr:hypothetical protein M5689_013758 [Euphorbia peplus]